MRSSSLRGDAGVQHAGMRSGKLLRVERVVGVQLLLGELWAWPENAKANAEFDNVYWSLEC